MSKKVYGLNEQQKTVLQSYCGGDFSFISTDKELDDCGDGLLAFIVREVGDVTDGVQASRPASQEVNYEEAIRAITVAKEQLSQVIISLADASDMARIADKKAKQEGSIFTDAYLDDLFTMDGVSIEDEINRLIPDAGCNYLGDSMWTVRGKTYDSRDLRDLMKRQNEDVAMPAPGM